MSKRVKILVSVLMVVVLLTVGSTVAVMAQEKPTLTDEASGKGLLARVVEILNEQGYDVTEEALVNAFKQAAREVAEETVDNILGRLQEEGLFLEDEIAAIENWLAQRPESLGPDSIREWLEERPEISHPGLLIRSFGFPHWIGERLHSFGEPRLGLRSLLGKVAEILKTPEETLMAAFDQAQQAMIQEVGEQAFLRALERAVDEGRISPDEARLIEEWWEQRPEALESAFPGARILPAPRGRHGMGIHKGWCVSKSPRHLFIWIE